MDKKGMIGTIVLVGVLVVVGFFWFVRELDEEEVGDMCVPATCCHAKECILKSEAPNCSGAFCTMSCEPETMDCGQGHCEFVDGECGVVWNE